MSEEGQGGHGPTDSQAELVRRFNEAVEQRSTDLMRTALSGGAAHLSDYAITHGLPLIVFGSVRRQEQLDTIDWFLQRAADAAGRGEIEIATMGDFAPAPEQAAASAAAMP